MAIAKQTKENYKPPTKAFICKYCERGFSREKTLTTHVCEQKRRWQQEGDKGVQLGLQAYLRFYEMTQGGDAAKKSYGDFVNSQYYNAFVKFGSFLNNVKPLYPEKYIDHVVTSGVKLDHWCKEEMYEAYALEVILKEDVATALERAVKTMSEWADEHKPAPWNHYFQHVSANRAVWHIKDGKISPWLILNCKTGKQMLSTFNDEQLELVYHVINPEHWAMRFNRNPKDVELVKQVAQEAKL